MYSTLAMSKDQPNFFQDISQILKGKSSSCILCLLPISTLRILLLAVQVSYMGYME